MPAHLLERGAEPAAIADRLDAATPGQGTLVVVEGAQGIGKSSLLAATGSLAGARGMLVVHARAASLEQAYGLGVVRQVFEQVRAGCDPAEWEGLSADAAGLAPRGLDPATPDVAPGEDVTHATLHGLFWLVATPAERRVAALAAVGHTNPEIAQQLFATQRTVETYITHAFAKGDVTSRDERRPAAVAT